MRLPRKVKVGANTVFVRMSKNDSLKGDCGEFDPANMLIRINSKLGAHQVALTLIHECLHAMWWDAGLPKKEGEERIVSALEGRLGALIRDNPKLVSYLQEKLK